MTLGILLLIFPLHFRLSTIEFIDWTKCCRSTQWLIDLFIYWLINQSMIRIIIMYMYMESIHKIKLGLLCLFKIRRCQKQIDYQCNLHSCFQQLQYNFAYSAPRLWNNLLLECWLVDSLSKFRKHMKTPLFIFTYPS